MEPDELNDLKLSRIVINRGSSFKKPIISILSNIFDTDNLDIKRLNKVKHSFSHYNLEAIPYLVKVQSSKKCKNSVWVNYKNIESLGLPAPIKKTIYQITKP